MRHKIRFCLLLVMLFFAAGNADSLWGQMKMEQTIRLQWQGVAEQHFASDTLLYMDLESGVYEDIMPVFYQSFPIYDDAVKVSDRQAVALAR